MPFSQGNGLRYYTFEIFPNNIIQAVFTRQGGVSPHPWDSLNVGGSIGDDITHVRENRIRSFKALGRAPESIHDVWQVHSADVIYADAPRSARHGLSKSRHHADRQSAGDALYALCGLYANFAL